MSLIKCPECSHEISDKAEICPYCGCPKKFFNLPKGTENPQEAITDYETIRKMLHDFSDEWRSLFGQKKYIARSEANKFYDSYSKYIGILNNPYTHEYIRNNGGIIGFEARQSQVFLNRMAGFIKSVDGHNEKYVNEKLIENKEYFDEILKPVDSAVLLDEDQRRAVITDEDYCLLVAGAGAGKTTTMAAKVKYLVDKQGISPADIIVISYTNKAINELKDRINNKLGIPVPICTFHKFGYDILQKHTVEPPTVNYSAYKYIFECIEKHVYEDKSLLKKVLMFLGYYFDIPYDVMNFKSLDEYCSFVATQQYESIKSRLGAYNQMMVNRRTHKQITITGEYLRSIQEVQIANFLFLNGIDYQYEKPYPHPIMNAC